MPTEMELKLSLTPDDCTYLLQLPLLESLSTSHAETHKLYTIYYDTPQLDLKHQRIALRLRRINDHWLQSIKGKERHLQAYINNMNGKRRLIVKNLIIQKSQILI